MTTVITATMEKQKRLWEQRSWELDFWGPEEVTSTPKLKGDKGFLDVERK